MRFVLAIVLFAPQGIAGWFGKRGHIAHTARGAPVRETAPAVAAKAP